MSHLTLSTPFFYSLQMAIFILYANCQLLPEIAPLMRDKNIVDLLYIFEKFLGTIHDPHPNASQTLFLPHTLNLVSCFPCFSEKTIKINLCCQNIFGCVALQRFIIYLNK